MPEARRMLSQMAELGFRGTELGPAGFLPSHPHTLHGLLERYGLELVGGFCPLVLHRPHVDFQPARRAAELLAAAGGQVLVAAVIEDHRWSAPQPLDDDGWRRLSERLNQLQALIAEYRLALALHPHVGTLIETKADVERALDELEVGWCLDTGHLLIGGTEPLKFARAHGARVVHVHLKDVDDKLATRVREHGASLLDATRQGLFLPLGKGGARIASVLEALAAHRYDGWFVLEQDTAITDDEPTVQGGPMRDARESIAYLRNTAPTNQEVYR
jgi:inosose dehydratase